MQVAYANGLAVGTTLRLLPHNIEAEQALLGAGREHERLLWTVIRTSFVHHIMS